MAGGAAGGARGPGPPAYFPSADLELTGALGATLAAPVEALTSLPPYEVELLTLPTSHGVWPA